jgi:hypothetical protein
MKLRQASIYFIGLISIALLAIFLRSAVKTWIILPLVRVFWILQGYYGAFPQAAFWLISLGFGVLIATLSIRLPAWELRRKKNHLNYLPGSVREMAFWIRRSYRGIYPKWYIAHLLAELALDIQDRRGTHLKQEPLFSDPNLNSPPGVGEYLDAALSTSYTDYKRPRKFRPQEPTPFDHDLETIIKYLESLMEIEHDQHS